MLENIFYYIMHFDNAKKNIYVNFYIAHWDLMLENLFYYIMHFDNAKKIYINFYIAHWAPAKGKE
jgi:hypothetical protein